MKKASGLRYVLVSLVLTGGLYILAALSFHVTGVALLMGFLGPKNCLPAIFFLLFGPVSGLGLCAGAIVSGILLGTSVPAILVECLCVLMMGWGTRLFWYSGKGARPIRLKRWRDVVRFIFSAVAPACFCGVLGSLFSGEILVFWQFFISYSVWTYLLGMPILILTTSILGLLPACPAHCPISPQVEQALPPGPESVAVASDRVEALCDEGGITRARSFQLQNCIEELLVRILATGAEEGYHLRIYVNDSISLHLSYAGAAYNPLRAGRGENKGDLMSLMLIRQRALRAAHQYHDGVNEVHIVL